MMELMAPKLLAAASPIKLIEATEVRARVSRCVELGPVDRPRPFFRRGRRPKL